MVSEQVVVTNEKGFHLRPAGNLCKEALLFKSSIQIVNGTRTGNAKSMLSVLSVCVKCGDEITVICDGEDEQEALQDLLRLIRGGLTDELLTKQ